MSRLKKYVVSINGVLIISFATLLIFTALSGQVSALWLVILLLSVGATLLLVNVMLKRITTPINQLINAALTLKNNAPIQPINANRYDFLHDVALTLNKAHNRSYKRSAKLDLAAQQLSTLLASMTEGIIAADNKHTVLHLNQAAITMLAINSQDFIGKPLWEVIRSKELNDLFNDTLNSGLARTVKVEYLSPNRCYLQLKSAPLKHEGEIIGAVIVLSDVSQMHRLDAIRKDFIANASHELKTPITAITGLVETILDDNKMPAPTRTRFLQKIAAQSTRIDTIVSQLLALSKAEGNIELSYQDKIILGDVAAYLTDQYKPLAELKKIAFAITCQEADFALYGNQETLLQAIGNIVNNAIKYTDNNGKVAITLKVQESQVLITIKDNGIGIAKADQASIFERFYRADKAHNTKIEGSGLGLAIARQIIIAHRGTIDLKSALGKGSTFYISLPSD